MEITVILVILIFEIVEFGDNGLNFLRSFFSLRSILTFFQKIRSSRRLILQLFAESIVEIVQFLAFFDELVLHDYHFGDNEGLVVIKIFLKIIFFQLEVLFFEFFDLIIPLLILLFNLLFDFF